MRVDFTFTLAIHVRDHTSPEQWHYVLGKDNPAKEASRSLTASQLLDNRRWFHGPEFLWKGNVPLLNSVQRTQLPKNDVEVRTKVLATAFLPPLEPTDLLVYIYRTSSWYKAKASVAWMRRAIFNLPSALSTCRAYCSSEVHPVKATNASKSGQSIEISPLTVQELIQSEKVILCDLQHHHFGFAIQSLKNLNGNSDKFQDRNTARRRKEVLKKTSCLYKLDPFVDGDGLLRIGGRIHHAAIPPEVKHPLILPKSSHVTDLIVRHFHSKIGHHQGRGITHNAIRQAGYWIIDGRSSVVRIISKCVTCRRLRSPP